jgi:hypothetical protein
MSAQICRDALADRPEVSAQISVQEPALWAHVRLGERRRAVCHHRDVVTFRLLVEWAGGGNVDPFLCGVEHLSDRGLGAAQRAVGEGWSP